MIFLSPLGMKAEADNYYGAILLSVISYHFSGMHKKLSVLLNEAKIAALGRALSGTLL